MRRLILAAAAASTLVLGVTAAAPAQAGPQRTTHVYKKMVHFACARSGYTYAVDQHWSVTEWGNDALATKYELRYEDEGTSPSFHADLVDFSYNGSLYSHGTGGTNSVATSYKNATPTLYNTPDHYFDGAAAGTWRALGSISMIVHGVGAGSAYESCTDNTPTITSD